MLDDGGSQDEQQQRRQLTTNVRPATGQAETYLVVADGEIDLSNVAEFKEAVSLAVEQTRSGHVIIDLTDVSYMDSSGFGTLLSATKKIRPAGGKVFLVGCNDVIARMLRITRLNTIFDLYASEEEALRALPPPVSADLELEEERDPPVSSSPASPAIG